MATSEGTSEGTAEGTSAGTSGNRSEDNRAVVRRAWKAFGTRDPEVIAPFFDPDAEWLAPAGNATAVALGGSHHMRGRDAVLHFLTRDFPRLFVSGVSLDFRGFHADGDVVVVEETMTATLSNGNHYENDYCFVFQMRDGVILRVREYMDTARAARMIIGDPPEGHGSPADGPDTA